MTKKTNSKHHLNKIKILARVLILSSLVLLLPSSRLYSDYENTGLGARASGMANSFVALADDVYALGYNPAGLGQIKARQLATNYNKLFWGLDDGTELAEWFIGYAHPVQKYPNWLSRFLFNTLNLAVEDYGTLAFGAKGFSASSLYTENTYTISYAKTLSDIIRKPIYFGMNFNILSKTYGQTLYTENSVDFLGNTYGRDPVFSSGYGKLNLAVDMGFIYKTSDRYSLGLSFKNLNSPNTGLKDESLLPLETKFGMCYKENQTNLLVDVLMKKSDTIYSTGYERWFMKNEFAIRTGMQIGSRELANFSVGASYKHSKFVRLDYSLTIPINGIKGTNGTHRLGILVFFKQIEKEEIEFSSEYLQGEQQYNSGQYIRATDNFAKCDIDQARRYILRIKSKMQKIINKEAKNKDFYYASGLLNYIAEKYEDCLYNWEEYMRLDPNNPEINEYTTIVVNILARQVDEKVEKLMEEARQYYSQKKYTSAIRRARQVLNFKPEHPDAKMLISESKNRMEENKRAQVNKYHTNALTLFTKGEYQRAINEWRKALRLDPNFREAAEYIKKAKNKLSGKPDEPVKPKPVVKEEPKPVIVDEHKAEEFYNEALIKYSEGNLEGAIKDLEEAIKLNPQNVAVKEALDRIRTEHISNQNAPKPEQQPEQQPADQPEQQPTEEPAQQPEQQQPVEQPEQPVQQQQ